MQLSGSKFPGNLAYLVVEEIVLEEAVSDADFFLRRGAMMAGIALPEWDYGWKTADGVYPSEDGWTKTVSGTGKESKGTYYQMSASKNNDYIQYTWPDTYTKGAIQISFRLATGYGSCLRLYLSNGTSAIGVRVNFTSSNSNY
jgi:hypothetical protein